MIRNFNELIASMQGAAGGKTVAVVAAHDEHTLEAVALAYRNDMADPVLIGDRARIREIIDARGFEHRDVEIIEEKDEREAAKFAISMIRQGAADFIMKGRLQTADLLKEVVNKEHGLQMGGMISHIAFFELPNYHKLLALTDGGMLPHPNVEDKAKILVNAVRTLHTLGYENPKVAALAATEIVNPKVLDTVDAAVLKKMNLEGRITGCTVEGPISLDLTISREAARIKGFESPVTGDADVLLVPDMTSGNMLAKSFQFLANAKMAGMIIGAKVPIVLVSRGASAEEKYLSMALSAAASVKERKRWDDL